MSQPMAAPPMELVFVKLDGFGRKQYKTATPGYPKLIYKEVDGEIYFCSSDGEPASPISFNYLIKD